MKKLKLDFSSFREYQIDPNSIFGGTQCNTCDTSANDDITTGSIGDSDLSRCIEFETQHTDDNHDCA